MNNPSAAAVSPDLAAAPRGTAPARGVATGKIFKVFLASRIAQGVIDVR